MGIIHEILLGAIFTLVGNRDIGCWQPVECMWPKGEFGTADSIRWGR